MGTDAHFQGKKNGQYIMCTLLERPTRLAIGI